MKIVFSAFIQCFLPLISFAIFASNECQDAYFSDKLSVHFPAVVAELELSKVTDFEKSHSGLGVGLSYRGDGINADIYVYNMGFNDIPDGIDSELAQMALQHSIIGINEQAKRRIYNNLKDISAPKVKKIGSVEFLNRKFHYIKGGLQRESLLLITCKSGNFIKIRLTYNTISDSDLRTAGQFFLKSISKIIASANSDMQTQKNNAKKGEKNAADKN